MGGVSRRLRARHSHDEVVHCSYPRECCPSCNQTNSPEIVCSCNTARISPHQPPIHGSCGIRLAKSESSRRQKLSISFLLLSPEDFKRAHRDESRSLMVRNIIDKYLDGACPLGDRFSTITSWHRPDIRVWFSSLDWSNEQSSMRFNCALSIVDDYW
jgi:hypothetical protein